jgi:hypothetical protein
MGGGYWGRKGYSPFYSPKRGLNGHFLFQYWLTRIIQVISDKNQLSELLTGNGLKRLYSLKKGVTNAIRFVTAQA